MGRVLGRRYAVLGDPDGVQVALYAALTSPRMVATTSLRHHARRG